jgi:hypothetical protein
VEHSERISDLYRVGGIFYRVKGLSAFNKGERAPERPLRVNPMVTAVVRQKHARDLPSALSFSGELLQTPLNMFGSDAHILHDKLRTAEHLRVDALQDKVFFSCGIQRHQKSAIDVAASELPDICDLALRPELPCNGKKTLHGFTS